ncbi:MAG: pseudouridine synthase [Paracoccaceae bacterium]|nr:pseudouridine synthase [Paracoccaceae bacterium]
MIGAFTYAPPDTPLDVIHVDSALLLVNKPAGLLSVPGKAAEHADCLESRVKTAHPPALLVHRLDMDTSGIMVFAMNRASQRHLGLQFERRHVAKTYVADVWGQVDGDKGEVDLPLITDWPNRPLQMVCHERGRHALTRWRVVSRHDGWTRLHLFPHTGRSHQLRVHMRALGHPIMGDRFYASGAALAARDRLALHAEVLELYHPEGGQRMRFVSHCPF